MDARRHFTPEKQPIQDARAFVQELITPARHVRVISTASSFNSAAESGFIETG